MAVEITRTIAKADMALNHAMPQIDLHPETCAVRTDGKLITGSPATTLLLAPRYFL